MDTLIEKVARAIALAVERSHSSDPNLAAIIDQCWREYIDQAEAAIEALRKHDADGWQPIETCPRNGLNFLAASTASSVFFAHWANGLVDSSSWTEDGGYASRHATHWQPLPPPPVAHRRSQLRLRRGWWDEWLRPLPLTSMSNIGRLHLSASAGEPPSHS